MSGCRVFIGRLNPAAREKDVERFFKGYGRIRDIDLKRGFGFVEFEDPRDADDAVYELDGKELCSERVTIEHARARSRGRGRGRYSDRFSSRRLRSDRRVVEFASYSDLKNAIEKLSGKEINGRKIKLIEGSKRHSLLGPNSAYEGSLCSHGRGGVASAVGDRWYRVVPAGGWEKRTAHALLGCALDLSGFCVEKL
ncbi:hypothetical protein DUI87_23088 [Hirundo rustica rustica]|uniref:RRM domain-containing protein n=1 Tax=Hirundo rustica rustica TaxID=333673 RepID=A0A3M0JH62_HIRRU|nr:hypothetical protein DUI87_23088 [Hirundo rustica rustica]